jgi:hypothetical protein
MRTRRIIALFGIAMIGAGVVVWRVLSGRGQRPVESPAAPRPVSSWVEAVDGSCPASHPVKAKEGSGIYHLPGSSVYHRTRPDRCYVDAAAAEADGYRAAKTAAARSTA